MADENVCDMMMAIPNYYKPEGSENISATVQCIFTGSQASDWVIKINPKTCTVEEGQVEHPNLTIKAKAQDGIKLLMGKMDPMRAFMLGKIKVIGDLSLGMKLAKLFKVE